MNSEGKPPEPSHDMVEDAFFSRAPDALSVDGVHAEPSPSDVSLAPRPSKAEVPSSADDELTRVPDLAPDYDEDAVLGRNRGPGAVALALVLGGAMVGGAAGYFVLRKESPQVAPVVAVSASASAAKVVATPTVSASETVTVPSEAIITTAKVSSSGSRPVAAKSTAPADTAAYSGAGPSGGSGPSGPSAGAKGELTAGEISGVVDRNRPLIKRRCWQPGLAMGAAGSARVNASFTIGPSGSVQIASASGAENDYPGLASCIAARIREWKFPPSSGSTPVNVPFVFAAQ